MSDPFAGIELLEARPVAAGERWTYSAGFNVDASLSDTSRIDVELEDIDRLARAGGRVAILSHQGSHADATARHLDHVAAYLSRRLGRSVAYVPDAAGATSVERAASLRDGEVALFANTRLYPGEERNDRELARRFAELGDAVAIGGFSKAHRRHASNVGILEFRRGFATRGLVSEVRRLAPWAGTRDDRYSVAVVGGLKREKVTVGLEHFTRTYDLVIPSGAVLNSVLRESSHEIGSSTLGECGGPSSTTVRRVLARENRAKLHIPEKVIVARTVHGSFGDVREIRISEGVPPGYAIVDFHLEPWARTRLAALERQRSRALVAGTPSRCREGFSTAAGALLQPLNAAGVETLLLGGDTVADLPWSGPNSTGGGSALQYLATGSCAVLDALRATKTEKGAP